MEKNKPFNQKRNTVLETVLNSINRQLNITQSELYNNNVEDQVSVHVVGAPRSGTTLLTQLILSKLDIGYINNLIAAFWDAPLYGIHLSNKLLRGHYQSNLKSNFGRTTNINEPHEFSYFWKHQLQYCDHLQQTYNLKHNVPWDKLKSILYQMGDAFEKPVIYKSFIYGFHIEESIKYMPKTLFLHIKRDTYQNAFSILKLRKKMFNDEKVWASIKPHQYSFLKKENIYRQIIGQILFLNYEYEKQLTLIPSTNKLCLNYSRLCNETNELVNQVYYKINNLTEIKYIEDNEEISIKENIAEIPKELIIEFEKAEFWLRSNFTELNKDNV